MTGIWEDQSKQGEQLFPEKGCNHWSNHYPLKKRNEIRVIETKKKPSALDYNTIQYCLLCEVIYEIFHILNCFLCLMSCCADLKKLWW